MGKNKVKVTDNGSVINKLAEEIVQSVSKDNPSSNEPKKYVVVRDDIRVSDVEYGDPSDPEAISEKNYWNRIVSKWSPNEKVEIVQYNKKRHRVW